MTNQKNNEMWIEINKLTERIRHTGAQFNRNMNTQLIRSHCKKLQEMISQLLGIVGTGE